MLLSFSHHSSPSLPPSLSIWKLPEQQAVKEWQQNSFTLQALDYIHAHTHSDRHSASPQIMIYSLDPNRVWNSCKLLKKHMLSCKQDLYCRFYRFTSHRFDSESHRFASQFSAIWESVMPGGPERLALSKIPLVSRHSPISPFLQIRSKWNVTFNLSLSVHDSCIN